MLQPRLLTVELLLGLNFAWSAVDVTDAYELKF
jgi:hypothetical protein